MVAVLALPVAAFASVIGSDIYLLGPGEVVGEDLVLSASTARVQGTIDGDLTVAAGTARDEWRGDRRPHGAQPRVGDGDRRRRRFDPRELRANFSVPGAVADDVLVTAVGAGRGRRDRP